MPRIHVGLDLEHEPRQRLLQRLHLPLPRIARLGSRRVRGERREELLHTEVADGRPEEDRCLPPPEVGLRVEHRGSAADELDFLGDRIQALAQELSRRLARQPLDHPVLADATALAREIHVDAVLEQVIDAAQLAAHPDRPGDGSRGHAQHLLDFIE